MTDDSYEREREEMRMRRVEESMNHALGRPFVARRRGDRPLNPVVPTRCDGDYDPHAWARE